MWVFIAGMKFQYFGHLMWKADSLRPWCWERLRAGGEGDDRGWDGWMAWQTRCTWVWVDSGSWWWTGRPGVLQFMELQRVRHDWATELNWWRFHSVLVSLIIFSFPYTINPQPNRKQNKVWYSLFTWKHLNLSAYTTKSNHTSKSVGCIISTLLI